VVDLHERLQDSVGSGRERPFVTLAYAQSLDGSIARERNRRLGLSCRSSQKLTHELRVAHDAILVGIGTVLADDPRLNVRFTSGPDPQPIVVDSRLRLPLDAHLLQEGRGAWVASTAGASPDRERAIRAKGAEVVRLPEAANGWVDLEELLRTAQHRGIEHLLVEGGARILTSFLESRLVDYVVVTISPQFIGGVPVLEQHELSSSPRLSSWRCERVGEDLVLAGGLCWSDP
jgi:GTP cyclohydrolase II